MFPFDKPLEAITADDIANLVANLPPEGMTHDYKRTTYTGGSAGSDLGLDVSAFAHAQGGYLLIGIDEVSRTITGIGGPTPNDPDREQLRLLNMLAMAVRPRIPHVLGHHVTMPDGAHVLIIEVRRSALGPHQVVNTGKFHIRNSNGNQVMDVDQLRRAFRTGPELADRLRLFRNERIGMIAAGETPVPLAPRPKLVIHVVPTESFVDDRPVDLAPAAVPATPLYQAFPGMGIGAPVFNLDGVLCHRHVNDDGYSHGYAQLMRNGVLEYALACHVDEVVGWARAPGLHAGDLHQAVLGVIETAKELERLQVAAPPLHLLMTVIGAQGHAFGLSDGYRLRMMGRTLIDRDIALLPGVPLQELAAPAEELAQPAIDLLWNLVGLPAAPRGG